MEGPDNSGKSTLVKWLADKAGARVIHSARPGPVQELKERIRATFRADDLASKDGSAIIFDRVSFISEHVYGPAFRDGCLLCKDGIEPFHLQAFRGRGGRVVYCRPPDHVIADASTHQLKDADTPEHLQKVTANLVKIAHIYDERMLQLWQKGIPVLPYDWTAGEDAAGNVRGRILDVLLKGVF